MGSLNRPKLHIPKTKLEWLLDIIGYIALVSMVLFIAINWSKLPDEVPAHFGVTGEVDRWGSKMELLIIPGITIFLHIILTVVEKRPEVHNYPARFNESNASVFYKNSRQTVNYLKNIINMLFAYTVYTTVSIALGEEPTLGWPFFVLIALTIFVVIWKVVKMSKIK